MINNVADEKGPPLSIQGAPIDILIDSITQTPYFKNKHFFILLDEYENFLDYQQRVVNTLIKHSGYNYSFKIGVRELGWRQRTTLNENEQLISPADYIRINITEDLTDEEFKSFASAVCNARISKVNIKGKALTENISEALPSLLEEEEAIKLGVKGHAEKIRTHLESVFPLPKLGPLDSLPDLYVFFLKYWAENQNASLKEIYRDFLANRNQWDTRYQNYKHSLLYIIRRHKRGIRKYYAGWDVFLRLSAKNIRYLLELVDNSFLLHAKNGGEFASPIPPDTQTYAAQNVGKKNLLELEGLSVDGAKLTKLLLALGRIFQVMAENPQGHAPEVNQFYLPDNKTSFVQSKNEIELLITSAIMHLALLRFSGSKLGDDGDTKNYDYMVHPIFAPFFVFSYRRKRKARLHDHQLLGLVNRPKETIREVLTQNNRNDKGNLPDQLLLFGGYYGETS